MKLLPGKGEEYKKRHDEIWPELSVLLRDSGVREYGIYLDEETHILFAVHALQEEQVLSSLPSHPIMQKWWDYMADIMEVNSDNSPKVVSLSEMFFLP